VTAYCARNLKEGGALVSDINKRVPTQEEIEVRAYELYLKRGGENGSALDDWLAAEKELTESLQRNAHELTIHEVVPSRKRAATS
jgi:hypothetical protein